MSYLEYDEKIKFDIVGSTEADSMNNKISNESPLGKALIGARRGQTVTVEGPAGEFQYKIVSITKIKN